MKLISLTYLYLIIFIGAVRFVIPQEINEERIESGQASIFYNGDLRIVCENTIWDKGIEFLINYPIALIGYPVLSVLLLDSRLLILSIIMWFPLIYLLFITVKNKFQPVGAGQPSLRARKSENHIDH